MNGARRMLAAGLIASLTTTLASLAVPSAAAEGTRLGRLFMTPEQRDEIDARRRARPEAAAASAPADSRPAERAVSRVDGVVRRSAGPAVVWIDEVPHQVQIGKSVGDVPGARLEGDTVVLRDAAGRTRRLRAGQSVDPQ